MVQMGDRGNLDRAVKILTDMQALASGMSGVRDYEADRCQIVPRGLQDKQVHVPNLLPVAREPGVPSVATF